VSSTPGDRSPRRLRLVAARKPRRPTDSSGGARTHRNRRLIIASALILVAGLAAGIAGITAASGAGGSHPVRVHLTYSCQFPSGTYQVSAIATATFPASAAAGTPIEPADLELTITLPRQAVAYLRGLGSASVSATGSLAVTATSGGTHVPATWPVRTATAAALPATGSASLDTSGTAPPASVSKPGTITFAASGLALLLTPQRAAGTATNPATVTATCAAGGAATPQLASVLITGASPSPSSSASHAASSSAAPASKPKYHFPKGCGDIKVHGLGSALCGYLVGYTDVKKLYGASKLGPVLVNIDYAYKHVFKPGKLIAYSAGKIYDQADKGKAQFPPVRSTFLGFGFVPVTATLNVVEKGLISIVSVSGTTKPPYPITVTATSTVTISISDVTVNGTRLPVGAGCRAARPVKLTLVGHGTNTFPPVGYTLPTGGPLSGFLTIPRFIDCGVTENLDPLLTGSISGPGNFAKMTQGRLCGPVDPKDWTCPPPVPKPVR